MNTSKEEIIRKAKIHAKRNFKSRDFRRYYREYYTISEIPALEFLSLVKAPTPNSNVFQIKEASYKNIKPVIPIADYIKFYEHQIIDKKRICA